MRSKAFSLVLLSLLGSLALSACGKHPAVGEIEALADRICACPDKKCVDAIAPEINAFKAKFADAQGSENDAKAILAAQKKLTECVKNLAK
ncbi:MAG: hypothetical protein U1F43_10655 [Myxococcota bacterium]